MIRISASLVKDFVSCPRKVSFRSSISGKDHQTLDMLHGSIVHYIIEKYWNNEKSALTALEAECVEEGIKSTKNMRDSIANFFTMFRDSLSSNDEIEKQFRFQFKKDVQIQGKIDRIHNHILYDWKSGYGEPEDLSRDPQFIIYNLAYQRLYKRDPSSLMYVSLPEARMYRYTPNKEYTDELLYSIIPYIVKNMKDNNYPRLGAYSYRTCEKCSHKKACLG